MPPHRPLLISCQSAEKAPIKLKFFMLHPETHRCRKTQRRTCYSACGHCYIQKYTGHILLRVLYLCLTMTCRWICGKHVKYENLSVFYGLITYAFKCHCDFNVYILSLSLILLSKSPFRVQITKINILLTTDN